MTLLAVMNGIKKIGTVSSGKMNAAGKAMDKFGALGNVGDKVAGGLDKMMQAINPFAPVIEALADIFGIWGDVLGAAFTPLVEKLYEIMLSPAVMTALDALGQAFGAVIEALMPLFDALAPLLPLIINVLVIPLKLLAGALELLEPIFDLIGDGIKYISDLFNDLGIDLSALRPILVALKNVVKAVADAIRAVINAIPNFLVGTGGGGEAWERMSRGEGETQFGNEEPLPEYTPPGDVHAFSSPSISNINDSITINVYGNVKENELAEIQKSTWLASIR